MLAMEVFLAYEGLKFTTLLKQLVLTQKYVTLFPR